MERAKLLIMRLNAGEAASAWPIIKVAIVNSGLCEEFSRDLGYYQQALISGEISCLLLTAPEKVYGVLLFSEYENHLTKKIDLLINAVANFRFVTDEEWHRVLEALKKIAATDGCSSISFFTTNKRLQQLARDERFIEKSFFTLELT